MSVKPINLIPALIDGMNNVNMKASASPTKDILISVLDSDGYQMMLQLTTVKLQFKGKTIHQLHWTTQLNYQVGIEAFNILQMWFSPKWSYTDPIFSRTNYICQDLYSETPKNPPTKTFQVWNDIGDLDSEDTRNSKVPSKTFSGEQVLDIETSDYLSEVTPSSALSNWASWYCSAYRGTDQTSVQLIDLKMSEKVKYKAGFKVFASPTSQSPLAFSPTMDKDFEYEMVDMGAISQISSALTLAGIASCLLNF